MKYLLALLSSIFVQCSFAFAVVDDTPYLNWPKTGNYSADIRYEIIDLKSQTGERTPEISGRKSLAAIRWFPTEVKGTVFWLYGGSCLSNNFPNVYSPDSLLEKILEHGYEVVLIDYKSQYYLRTNLGAFPEEKRPKYCEMAARDQVVEIQAAISEYNERFNSARKPSFLFGHSYGAFLVNHIMTNSVNPGIAGYISSHGIWNNGAMHSNQVDSVIPRSFRPIDQTPHLNAPALIFQSTQDYQVPYRSFEPFYEWSKSLPTDSYRLFLFKGAYHFLNADFFKKNPEFEREILRFLKRHSLD